MQDLYKEQAYPTLQREFNYANVMEVPKLTKIVLNIGLGEARENARALDTASADLATITGQKPVITRSKKSIANFRLREGMPIGVMASVTSAAVRRRLSTGAATTAWACGSN